jgi:hypothetical protein
MSEGVVVALIGASGAVLAAVVTAILTRPRHPPVSSPAQTNNHTTEPVTTSLQDRVQPPQRPPSEPVELAPQPAPLVPAPRPRVSATDQVMEEEGEAGDDEIAGRSRKEEALKVLFRHGRIRAGAVIEPLPQALPPDGVYSDPTRFRVQIVNPPNREVVWLADGKKYSSLSSLTQLLSAEHGLRRFKARCFALWRIIGHTDSMWDEAEQCAQQESRAGPGAKEPPRH